MKQHIGLQLTLVLGTSLLIGGCDDLDDARVEIEALEAEAAANGMVPERDITTVPQAVLSGWTNYTSEEGPPILCDGSSAVGAFRCSGSYCDNVSIYCRPTPYGGTQSYWTTYFSEETISYRHCEPGHWMVGLDCMGNYCDSVAMQCRHFPKSSAHSCMWTGWISDEGGGELLFPAGYYARSMQCLGSYCDNKRFYICKM